MSELPSTDTAVAEPPGEQQRSWFTPRRLSYMFMVVMLLLIGSLHMTSLLLSTLFSFFALRQFSFGRNKPLGVVLFVLMVGVAGYGLYFFFNQAYIAAPRIAETTIPAVVGFAERKGVELPFTDYQSLRQVALTEVREKLANVGRYARESAFLLLYVIIGNVVALSLFINARLGVEDDPHTARDSLYALTAREIALRFITFYRSFTIVMGAQIIISLINTVLTSTFLIVAGFPFVTVLTACTFMLGLLPIIGNILSNTLICGVAFTISPKMAFIALLFLITIHKLEYFLNSKIIGDRIKNPMWLTLLGLLLGEKLMGIPGMILAPIVLHYVKVESSQARGLAEPALPSASSLDDRSDLLLRV